MMNSFVLIKNLRSNSEELSFDDFKFMNIRSSWDFDLKRAQHLFPKAWPFYEDWIYVKGYENEERREKIPYTHSCQCDLFTLYQTKTLITVK